MNPGCNCSDPPIPLIPFPAKRGKGFTIGRPMMESEAKAPQTTQRYRNILRARNSARISSTISSGERVSVSAIISGVVGSS